jgi:hypothetical protein
MSGKAKEKVFVYNKKGKLVHKFSSIVEFADIYQVPNNFLSLKDIRLISDTDNFVASKNRVKSQVVINLIRYNNSKFVGKNKSNALTSIKKNGGIKKIQVFDLDGDLVATFENSFYLRRMYRDVENLNSKQPNKDGLIFKEISHSENN